MATFQGKRVSATWRTILFAARRDDVNFKLNSGQRTMSEQQALHDLYRSGRGNLAAVPNRDAPHIRAGREHHALDIQPDGGQAHLARWLRARGVPAAFNVPGESWHLDPVSEPALKRLAGRLDDSLRRYPADEQRWIREYDRLKRARRGLRRRRVLRRVMTNRRKSIWRAAQQSGWNKLSRRARYRSLLARTR